MLYRNYVLFLYRKQYLKKKTRWDDSPKTLSEAMRKHPNFEQRQHVEMAREAASQQYDPSSRARMLGAVGRTF